MIIPLINPNYKDMKKFLLGGNRDLGLLILRLSAGIILITAHGLKKLFGFSEMIHTFSDPYGFGNELSYYLSTGAEFLCSLLVVIGLYTRIAAIPVVINMATAAFVVLSSQPWAKQESAVMFLIPFLVILLSGPGKYSVDYYLAGQNKRE
jgi:putative oxidoreductase